MERDVHCREGRKCLLKFRFDQTESTVLSLVYNIDFFCLCVDIEIMSSKSIWIHASSGNIGLIPNRFVRMILISSSSEEVSSDSKFVRSSCLLDFWQLIYSYICEAVAQSPLLRDQSIHTYHYCFVQNE